MADLPFDEDLAAQKVLERRAARTNFTEFASYIDPIEPPADHQRLICDTLNEVVDGIVLNLPPEQRLRRVMIFCPPGSAKSTYASVRFPAYFLGRLPNKGIISASHEEDLAKSFGRKVKNVLLDPAYSKLFDTALAEDARAKGEWSTDKDGHYYACGLGTSITGRRADLGLIDDPVKSREAADSSTMRKSAWEWYRSDFYSRLKPDAAQVIIMTRWHEADLGGMILPDDWNGQSGDFTGFDGQTWRVICMPAEARENDILGRKKGEWLWPDFYRPDVWEEIKKVQTATDTRNWTALYQQVPRPEQGTFFKREWFKRYPLGDHPPLTLYGASDCAVTSEKDGGKDMTEHGIGGFDKAENLYFIDWWSGRVTMDKWIASELNLARRHAIMAWIKEGGQIRRASEPFLLKAKREGIKEDGEFIAKPFYYRSEWISSNKDKAANARAFQAMASMGQVYIPECEWGDKVIDQLVGFIPGANFLDDKVDVCGLFGRILDQTYGPRDVVVEDEPTKDSYDWDNNQGNNWMLA